MANTVWVVEQGAYSEHHVVGIFTSQENAQQVADTINRRYGDDHPDKATIGEWPLDPAINELRQGLRKFLIQIQEDGTIEHIEQRAIDDCELNEATFMVRRKKWLRKQPLPDVLNVNAWAKDAAHAIKIANEHRTRLIATGGWAHD